MPVNHKRVIKISKVILKESERVTTAADVLTPNVTWLEAGVVMAMQ